MQGRGPGRSGRQGKARAYVTCKEQPPRGTVAPLEEMVDLATPDVQGRGPHAEGCKAISGRLVRCQEAVAEVGIRVRSHRAISADRKETR